jgi:hypothetical protein
MQAQSPQLAHSLSMIKTVSRTSRKEVTRHKAYGHTTNRKIS